MFFFNSWFTSTPLFWKRQFRGHTESLLIQIPVPNSTFSFFLASKRSWSTNILVFYVKTRVREQQTPSACLTTWQKGKRWHAEGTRNLKCKTVCRQRGVEEINHHQRWLSQSHCRSRPPLCSLLIKPESGDRNQLPRWYERERSWENRWDSSATSLMTARY